MVTPGVRIVALAAFASTRCCSFPHGSSRLVRIAPSRSEPQLSSAIHTSLAEQGAKANGDGLGRTNADDISFDTTLISKDPNLVLGHLRARRMGEDSIQAVQRIGGTPLLRESACHDEVPSTSLYEMRLCSGKKVIVTTPDLFGLVFGSFLLS